MKKNKYLLAICIIFVIILTNCGFIDVKKQFDTRPAFDVQKIYYLTRYMIEISPTYYVWTRKYAAYFDLKDKNSGTIYSIYKNLSLTGTEFTFKDIKTKKKLYHIREDYNQKTGFDEINYKISDSSSDICSIKQLYKKDLLHFELIYKNTKYSINGIENSYNNITYSFNYMIKKDDVILANIYKDYNYFSSEYEIIINKKEKEIDDKIFLCIGVIFDDILKKSGFNYK